MGGERHYSESAARTSSDQRTEIDVTGPALALLELEGTPAGFVALDALAKEAPVSVLAAGTVQCGHFLIAFAGEVEPVSMSFDRATRVASAGMIDAVLLPHAEPRIVPAMQSGKPLLSPRGESLGVVQAGSSPTLLRAVDAALKGALVDLVELRLAEGLGGRGLATLWGDQHDVEAALSLATEAFSRGRGAGCTTSLIANADVEVSRALGAGTRFFKEWRG